MRFESLIEISIARLFVAISMRKYLIESFHHVIPTLCLVQCSFDLFYAYRIYFISFEVYVNLIRQRFSVPRLRSIEISIDHFRNRNFDCIYEIWTLSWT